MGPVVDVISSDRFGRRRTWIVLTQSLMTVTLLAAMPVNFTTELRLFTFVIMAHNFFCATQDVAIDALACNVLSEQERGLANGLMYGTRTALFMDITTPAVAATQFTAYMALMNLVISYSATWQGWSIENWGYPLTLVLDGAAGMLCLACLPFMVPRAKAASPVNSTEAPEI